MNGYRWSTGNSERRIFAVSMVCVPKSYFSYVNLHLHIAKSTSFTIQKCSTTFLENLWIPSAV